MVKRAKIAADSASPEKEPRDVKDSKQKTRRLSKRVGSEDSEEVLSMIPSESAEQTAGHYGPAAGTPADQAATTEKACPEPKEEESKAKGRAEDIHFGPGLKTFIINLARRKDRRAHVEELCNELGLDYEVIAAVDGRALSERQDSSLEIISKSVDQSQATTDAPTPATSSTSGAAASAPRGFSGLKIRMYRARWQGPDGKPREQLLRMAEHRLLSSELTQSGHELWGAVGCSASHQVVLQRLIDSPNIEWALVLEDDATLNRSAAETKEIFAEGMRYIRRNHPECSLVYLGGHVSTNVKRAERRALRVNENLCVAMQVYQTHAFLIHRSLAPTILDLMQRGFAADAAFVSWSRTLNNRSCTLLFDPQLLVQPGGSARWKDSDIFVEGEFFKEATAQLEGSDYKFNATRSRRPRCRTLIPRGSAEGIPVVRQFAARERLRKRAAKKAKSAASRERRIRPPGPRERTPKEKAMKSQKDFAKEVCKKVSDVLSHGRHLTFLGLPEAVQTELKDKLPAALRLLPLTESTRAATEGAEVPASGKCRENKKVLLPADLQAIACLRAALVKIESGFQATANEIKASIVDTVTRFGASWQQSLSVMETMLPDVDTEKALQRLVQHTREHHLPHLLTKEGPPSEASEARLPPAPSAAAPPPAQLPQVDSSWPCAPQALAVYSMCQSFDRFELRSQEALEAIQMLDRFTVATTPQEGIIISSVGHQVLSEPKRRRRQVAKRGVSSSAPLPPSKKSRPSARDAALKEIASKAKTKRSRCEAGHPLEPSDWHHNNLRWECDGCGSMPNDEMVRYRCTQGCDYDLCQNCWVSEAATDIKTEPVSALPVPQVPIKVPEYAPKLVVGASTTLLEGMQARPASLGPPPARVQSKAGAALPRASPNASPAAFAANAAKLREEARCSSAFKAVNARASTIPLQSAAVAAAARTRSSGSTTTRTAHASAPSPRRAQAPHHKILEFSSAEKIKDLEAMSISELRKKALYHSVNIKMCFEKSDLVTAVVAALKTQFMKSP